MKHGRHSDPGRVRAWLVPAVLAPLAVLAVLVTGLPGGGSDGTVAGEGAGPEALAQATATAPPPTLRDQAAAPARAVVATPVPVVQRGDGRPVVVRGTSARRGSGPLRRYRVEVEGRLGVDPVGFARAVEATLGDRRSWAAAGRLSFQRVDRGPVDFRVVLASPDTTDRLCRPLDTGGTYSCANGGAAVINARRWLRGADAYRGDLPGYRQYVVNHEVGHTLGHGHERCPGRGRLAPVMVQQTKGVGTCRANPWPYPA